MRIVGIDTTTGRTGVALLDDGRLAGLRELAGLPSHSRRLLPLLVELLESAGLRLGALDALAVSAGPGSFTGLRVGLATANGLSLALGVPVVAVPTLAAFAWYGRAHARGIVPWLDARRGEVFAARFVVTAGRLRRVREDRVLSPARAVAELVEPGDLLLGEGAIRHDEWLRVEAPQAVLAAPFGSAAEAVGRLGLEALAGTPGERQPARPIYVRRPDAELPSRA